MAEDLFTAVGKWERQAPFPWGSGARREPGGSTLFRTHFSRGSLFWGSTSFIACDKGWRSPVGEGADKITPHVNQLMLGCIRQQEESQGILADPDHQGELLSGHRMRYTLCS